MKTMQIKQTFQNRPLVVGTLLLTLSGALTRLLGFLYRIYLSRIFGAEGMGLFQLTAPVLAITYALCSAGFHTAVSKQVSAEISKGNKQPQTILMAAIALSLPLSIICALAVYYLSPLIAGVCLLEPRTTPYLKVMAYVIPWSALHACVNGYFYGLQKSHVPALSQFIEQCGRILFVYIALSLTCTPSLSTVIWGMVFGEGAGVLCDVLFLKGQGLRNLKWNLVETHITPLNKIAIPTSANRLTLNLMQSFEAIVLPNSLRQFGCSQTEALSTYGTLTGMALPFILFPNALTSSLSMVLLPAISSKHASGEEEPMNRTVRKATSFSILMGLGFAFLFLVFGDTIGALAFHSNEAGKYLRMLALTCPFLYLNTTLAGILQGYGKILALYRINVICLALRLTIVLLLVPHYGIVVYFWGLLASQTLQSILSLGKIKNRVG